MHEDVQIVVARLIHFGIPCEPSYQGALVERIERACATRIPSAYATLLSGYSFPTIQLDSALVYGSAGGMFRADEAIPRDQELLRGILSLGFIPVGRVELANYDPVCLRISGAKGEVVRVSHEDVLLGRRRARIEFVASSIGELFRMTTEIVALDEWEP